jgi:hypothetical protein
MCCHPRSTETLAHFLTSGRKSSKIFMPHMLRAMTLQEILDRVDELGDDQVIFARRPWTPDSEAEIGKFNDNFRVPDATSNRGLDYFLEVSVAKEILEVFGETRPAPERIRALLMFYAENDAYPKWIYE